jgi:hypothetical protein
MKSLRTKPLLQIVWSRDADPSPEFYQVAEPGRVLIQRKKSLPVRTDLKVLSGAGNKRPPGLGGAFSSGRSLAFLTSGETEEFLLEDPLAPARGICWGCVLGLGFWLAVLVLIVKLTKSLN